MLETKTRVPIVWNERATRHEKIPHLPAAAGLVGVNAARHPEHTGNVHEVEGEVEADQEQPEMPFAQSFAQHAAGHLRIPVVEGGEEHEEDCTDQHVVKVSDDEIGAAKLPVEGGEQPA